MEQLGVFEQKGAKVAKGSSWDAALRDLTRIHPPHCEAMGWGARMERRDGSGIEPPMDTDGDALGTRGRRHVFFGKVIFVILYDE